MTSVKHLTLRAKLILAFGLIASFSIISSGAAVYLFEAYQAKLLSVSQSQGEPLIKSADNIEKLRTLSLQLERIKSAEGLSQRILALEEIETQWSSLLTDLEYTKSLNQDLSKIYIYNPESIQQLLTAIPIMSRIIGELYYTQEQNEKIHYDVLKRQEKILTVFRLEIQSSRLQLAQLMEAKNSLKLNLLTDIERRINKLTSLLLEGLSSKHNQELSKLAHRSLIVLKEIEQLTNLLDHDIKASTNAWLIQARPNVASEDSVFQQRKRQIRLKRILDSHIDQHILKINKLDKLTYDSVKFLKSEVVTNASQITKDIALASKLLIALAIVCLISVFLIVWLFVGRHIIRPFIETSRSMQLLAKGETQIAIPKSKEKEVQKMLRSLKVLQRYVAKVNDLAEKDSLTNIFNRRHFDKILNQTINDKQANSSISLLMCDLDHFKPYNDYYGHQQGDDCLKFFAQILERLSDSASDHACRYGGEEFAIIILNKPSHYAESLAQLICNETSKALIPHKQSKCADVVTVSVGVATLQIDEIKDVNHLISIADKALYQAKNNGRNCVLINEENGN
ncbi:diguanylate cyclase domain-containing protein [Marinomonas sp. PE14-40]|uniref:diguanylate cyclase domain-containing protein n=1 Tax=Marinomonas sp. PE14-40 TaxID=3060621 RepID=UPI003F66C78F